MSRIVTHVVSGDEAIEKLAKGINKVANAVKTTIGARGRTNIIVKGDGSRLITKDGKNSATLIYSEDPVENQGCQIIKEAAITTCKEAGDGTSSSCILAQSITIAGMEAIKNGANPVSLINGINKAAKIVVDKLMSLAKPIDYDSHELLRVAVVACNNDEATGAIIHEAVIKAGKLGVVTVKESKKNELRIESTNGFEFNSGFITPDFMNNTSKRTCEFEDCIVVAFDRKFEKTSQFVSLHEKLFHLKKPILIICEDLTDEALANVVVNIKKNPERMAQGQITIRVLAVRCPYVGDAQSSFMKDLCLFTGATYIQKEAGMELENISHDRLIECLGSCSKVVTGEDKTTIFGGGGNKEEILKEATDLKTYIEENNPVNIEYMQSRITRLSCSATVIHVGGIESELKELLDRIDDSVNATKYAAEEGIVAGGGVSYLNCKKELNKSSYDLDNEEDKGAIIIINALKQCFINILLNAGYSEENIEKEINAIIGSEYGMGFNVLTNKIENFLETGIINAVKSDRCAFINAVKASSVFLLSSNVIYGEYKE